jgi:DUF1365 family protein
LRSFATPQLITFTGGDAGSTMDAMSDAIEGADVMLYGVSLAYKESANVSALSNLRVFGSLLLCCSAYICFDADAIFRVLQLSVPNGS